MSRKIFAQILLGLVERISSHVKPGQIQEYLVTFGVEGQGPQELRFRFSKFSGLHEALREVIVTLGIRGDRSQLAENGRAEQHACGYRAVHPPAMERRQSEDPTRSIYLSD